MIKQFYRTLFLSCCFCLADNGAADAASVTNLTEGAKTLAILDGNKAVSVTLAAGETYHAMGALRLRFAERELRIEHDEEYAIWDDATISPQRRYKGGKRF